jgi:DNA-binding transcriptional MocR family regulator
MTSLKLLSAHEQVAAYLREGAQVGRWGALMPGVSRLAQDLGVNHKTVEAALRQLEREGLLQGRGPRPQTGSSWMPGIKAPPRPIKVGILLYEGRGPAVRLHGGNSSTFWPSPVMWSWCPPAT